MSYDPNQDVHVAEIVAQPAYAPTPPDGVGQPPTKPKSCLIPVLIVLGLLLLILIGGGVAIYRSLAPPDVIVENEEEATARRISEQSKVEQAFSNEFVPADQNELAQIEKLIALVSSLADDEVNPDLHECIDFVRYAREARRNPEAKRLAFFGNSVFAATVRQRTVGPIPFSQYRIFEIETISEDERKVTLQTWGTYENVSPYVWWVARADNNNWKLYDWEPVEFGVRDTKESAVLLGEDNLQRIRAYETYVDAVVDYVEETDDLSDSAKQNLLDCQSLPYHKALKDSTLYNIATHFYFNDDDVSAKTFLSAVKHKDATPGVYRLLGELALDQKEFADSVKHFQAYLDLIGPNRQVLTSLADAYEGLEDNQNELKTRRLALPLLEESYSPNLGKAFILESKEKLSSLFSIIENRDEPNEFFEGLMNQTSSNPFVIEKFESFVDYLEARTTKSDASSDFDKALAIEAKAQLAFTRAEFEEGLAWLESPLILDGKSGGFDYWDKAIEIGVVTKKFEASKDKEAAFEMLSYIFDEYEYEIESNVFPEITKIALQSDPENAIYNHLAGSTAYDEGEFETAIKYLAKAKQGFKDDPENDNADYNAGLLANCHYLLGDIESAVKGMDVEELKALMYVAVEKNDLTKLKAQIESLESSEEKEYLAARLLMENGKYEEASVTFVRLLKTVSNDPEYYGPRYRNISSLIECCRLNGAINDAFLRTYRKDVFDRIARTLINDKDWETADQLAIAGRRQLAKRTSRAVDLQSVLNLEHEILWHRGKFKELADSLVFDRDLTKIEKLKDDEFPDLEFIFRAALRTKNLILADQIASLSRNLNSPNFDILRLMALHQKDYKRLAKLKIEDDYEADEIFGDPDCPTLTKKRIRELIGDGPARIEMGYSGYYQDQHLAVLLSESVELDAARIKKIASQSFSAPVTIEELTDQPTGKTAWLVRSGRTVLAVSQSGDFPKPQNVESEKLESVFDKGKQVVTFEFFSLDWQARDPYLACLKLAQVVDFKNAIAIGLDHQWMTWSEGKSNLEKLSTAGILYSELEEGLASHYFNFQEHEQIGAQALAKFQLSLAGAYRQFVNSDSIDKRLVASVRMLSGQVAETIDIDVEKVHLETWGMNELEGKLSETSRMNPKLEKGDAVTHGTDSVFRWTLTIDGEESSNGLRK